MGGPWRESGFDPRALRPPRPRHEPRVEALGRQDQQERLRRIVLAYIAAVAASFGLLLGLIQQGW
jgi:hypothetical protein